MADAAGGALVVLQWFSPGSVVGGVDGVDYALVLVRSVSGEYVPRAVTEHELRRVKALSEAQLAKAAAAGSTMEAVMAEAAELAGAPPRHAERPEGRAALRFAVGEFARLVERGVVSRPPPEGLGIPLAQVQMVGDFSVSASTPGRRQPRRASSAAATPSRAAL